MGLGPIAYNFNFVCVVDLRGFTYLKRSNKRQQFKLQQHPIEFLISLGHFCC